MRGLRLLQLLLAATVVFCHLISNARPAPDEDYANFYHVSEKVQDQSQSSFNPLETIKTYAKQASQATHSLVRWTFYNRPLEKPPEKYNRSQQFGAWLVDKREQGCFNTRARVLVRDSESETTISPNGCTIATGQWNDRAVNKVFTDSRDVEIDHFVPLKNVYISGAWKWNQERRCMYTNFMGNKMHLIPFFKPENRKKADNTPEYYMPPEKSYRCEYLYKWLAIKLIWQVAINPKEAAAIVQYMRDEQCDPKKFVVSADFITGQRQFIEDNMELCIKTASQR